MASGTALFPSSTHRGLCHEGECSPLGAGRWEDSSGVTEHASRLTLVSPRTHSTQLQATQNAAAGDSTPSSGLLGGLWVRAYVHTHLHTHLHTQTQIKF